MGTALADSLGAHLLVDHDSNGAGWSHRQALRWGIDQGASHIVVVEDDALPIATFDRAVREAIEQRPDQILGLYVGQQRPRAQRVAAAVEQAESTGASWLTADGLMWGVAAVWPSVLAASFLDHTDDDPRLWDIHARRWCILQGHAVAYPWPCLVDHRDEPTLIQNVAPPAGRVAWRTGHPDWNGKVVSV